MIALYKYAAVVVIGLGGKSGGVDGDVWSSVGELLVCVSCVCGPSPEEAQVPFKVRVFVV